MRVSLGLESCLLSPRAGIVAWMFFAAKMLIICHFGEGRDDRLGPHHIRATMPASVQHVGLP